MENIGVIAAHPDDEILGCGATMHHHTENGDNVFVLIMLFATFPFEFGKVGEPI